MCRRPIFSVTVGVDSEEITGSPDVVLLIDLDSINIVTAILKELTGLEH